MTGASSFATPISLRLPADGGFTLSLTPRPVLSTHAMIIHALSGRGSSAPGVRAAVLDALGSSGLRHYSSILTPHDHVFYPRAIVPDHRDHDWATAAGDAIGDLEPDVLLDQLDDMTRLEDGAGWEPVIKNPRAWLTGIARAFTRVSVAILPWWHAAAARLAVEQSRMELVGSTPVGRRHFVNQLSSSVRLDEDALRIKWTEPSEESIGTHLELSPMIVMDPRAYLVLTVGSGTSYGYPMAAASQRPAPLQEPSNRLDALLGTTRARILADLDRPRTYSQLAELSGTALSTVSHHIDRLAAAGLVVTMPLGGLKWVLRTDAGGTLLDLLG